MKKIILCLICLTLVIGCKKEENKEEPKPIDPPIVEEELPPVEEYIDDNY